LGVAATVGSVIVFAAAAAAFFLLPKGAPMPFGAVPGAPGDDDRSDAAGDDLADRPVARYLRRIGPWLLWRAGPPSKGDARLWAARADDLATAHTFRLFPDGRGEGTGPSGATHERFRTWKEDLRDAG